MKKLSSISFTFLLTFLIGTSSLVSAESADLSISKINEIEMRVNAMNTNQLYSEELIY